MQVVYNINMMAQYKRNSKGRFTKGTLQPYGFKKGHTSWCKGLKGIHLNPETEFKVGQPSLKKGIKLTKKQKKNLNMSGLEKGRGWNRDKHRSKECREKISKSLTGRKQPKEVIEKRVRKLIGQRRTEEWKRERSKATKGKKSPMYGKKLTKEHIRNALRRREKSSLEIKVDEVIKKYNLPYKFVGNGKFFIERKNPDFININGEKIAIEVFCRKHKDLFRGGCDEWKESRSELFKKYGWEILFIEDWQTNNEETILGILKGGD